VRRKSMVLPVRLAADAIVASLVIYPAFYAIHLATLNKGMQHFVGFDNFLFLFKRNVLDGRRAIGPVCRHRGHFQGGDRVRRRAFRAQHPVEGAAQMAASAHTVVIPPATRLPGCGCSIPPTAPSTGSSFTSGSTGSRGSATLIGPGPVSSGQCLVGSPFFMIMPGGAEIARAP
jgi:hypothetical protein